MIRLSAGDAAVRAVAAAGGALAVGQADQTLTVWSSLFAPDPPRSAIVSPQRGYRRRELQPERVWFSPDGKLVFVSFLTAGETWYGSAVVRASDLEYVSGGWANIPWNRLAVSPDARWWATHNTYCLTVRHAEPPFYALWDPIPNGHVAVFAFSPTSDRLAVVERVWRYPNPPNVHRLTLFGLSSKSRKWAVDLPLPPGWQPSDVVWVEWSPSGERVALGTPQRVWVRRATDGHEVFTLNAPAGGRFGGIAFHLGSGQLAVAATDGTMSLFDPTNWRTAEVFRWGDEPLTAVGFSADGTLGVAGGQNGGVVVWDAA